MLWKDGSVIADIRLKNRQSAIDIYQQLITAELNNKSDDLTLCIDQHKYIFSYREWQSILLGLKKWVELYLKSTQ